MTREHQLKWGAVSISYRLTPVILGAAVYQVEICPHACPLPQAQRRAAALEKHGVVVPGVQPNDAAVLRVQADRCVITPECMRMCVLLVLMPLGCCHLCGNSMAAAIA